MEGGAVGTVTYHSLSVESGVVGTFTYHSFFVESGVVGTFTDGVFLEAFLVHGDTFHHKVVKCF